jgi:hemerythrin-like domain-containing protein
MAGMSMNTVIHRALRRDLDRFVAALEGFAPGDGRRAAQLGLAWDNFDEQLTRHHEGEHEVAWPHLERAGVSRQLLDVMDVEHEVMAVALRRARDAMTALRGDPSAGHAAAAGTAMRELRSATVEHLDHEERELEPFYLQNQDHPEVVAMGKAFARTSPARGGRFFAWLLDGATPEERRAAKSTVPAPVLAVISGVFGHGYRRTIAPVWRSGART